MTALDLGVHSAVDEDLYHGGDVTAEPALSASIAKILLTRSPIHAWCAHPALNPQQSPRFSSKFDLGTAAHSLILEGDKFAQKVATIDAADWRTKAAQAHRDACRESGRIPLLAHEWRRVNEMAEAAWHQINRRDDDWPLFQDGKAEQTLIWRDEATNVLCKARLDWLRDDLEAIDDLKTTAASASPHDWGGRTFWSIGADVQARFYQRGARTLLGVEPAFRFAVIETEPPYCLSVLDLAPSAVELADKKIDRALAIWKDCLERDYWPGYPAGIASVETAWQELDFFERHPEAMA